MIYATGYITIIIDEHTKPRKKVNRKTLKLKMLEQEKGTKTVKIKYAFTAFLPRSYECRFLEDYTGKIKPFIEKQISERIVSLQVTHLNYVSEQAMRKIKNRKN